MHTHTVPSESMQVSIAVNHPASHEVTAGDFPITNACIRGTEGPSSSTSRTKTGDYFSFSKSLGLFVGWEDAKNSFVYEYRPVRAG